MWRKSKSKKKGDEVSYTAVQNDEAIKKVGQLKKAMTSFKEKAEALQKELNELKEKGNLHK